MNCLYTEFILEFNLNPQKQKPKEKRSNQVPQDFWVCFHSVQCLICIVDLKPAQAYEILGTYISDFCSATWSNCTEVNGPYLATSS